MSNKFLISIGIIAGVWLVLSGGTFFMLLFALFVFLVLQRFVPKKDRTFILKVISLGFILRLVLMLLYYYFHLGLGQTDILGPDGEGYSQHGWYISRLLLEQDPYLIPNSQEAIFGSYQGLVEYFNRELPLITLYQVGTFTYFIGILYAIFDYSPFMIKLINSTFSVSTGIVVYFIGKEIFNSKIGKISTALLIFFPSILAYSITGLRDTITIFLLTMVVWLMMKFLKSKNWCWLILVLLTTVTVESVRTLIIFPLSLVITSTLLLSLRVGILKKCFIIILVSIVFLSIPAVREKVKWHLSPERFFSVHLGKVNTPGNNYKILPDRCYYESELVGIGPKEAAAGFIKGIFHLLFEPLPQKIDSISLLFAFLQNILFYLFIPFVIIGLLIGLRYRAYAMIPLTMYLIVFILLLAIAEGNVGTVFRHRDMLMPFFIILGVAGCYAKLRGDISVTLR